MPAARTIPITARIRRRRRLCACWLGSLALFAAGVRGAAGGAPRILLLDAELAGADVVAIGERGTIIRSADHGRSWVHANRPVRATLTALSFAPGTGENGGRGWAVGHDAVILTTADGGRTWSKQFQGENLQDSFLDVLALDATHIIAVGGFGLAVETKDGGRTWTSRKLVEEDPHLNRLTRGPTGTLYLAGENGTLRRSTDRGATWTPIPTPYKGSFHGVLPLDRRTLLAHGLRGHVFRSIDDGATWTQVDTPEPVLLAAAAQLKSNFILLAGYPGVLLVSRDYGKTFSSPGESPTKAIAHLLELPDGNLLAVGENGATILPTPR